MEYAGALDSSNLDKGPRSGRHLLNQKGRIEMTGNISTGSGGGSDARAPQFISQDYLNSLSNREQYYATRDPDTSLADALMRRESDNAAKQALAIASSTRGSVNPALLQSQAMIEGGKARMTAAQNAAIIQADQTIKNRQLSDQLALEYSRLGLTAAQSQALSQEFRCIPCNLIHLLRIPTLYIFYCLQNQALHKLINIQQEQELL